MTNARRVFARGLVGISLGCLLLLSLANSSSAQSRQQGEGMEAFEGVDPYTKGDRDVMEKLGYVNFENIIWNVGLRADKVEETMGGMPMLWVETRHFKIGSSLTTYRLAGGDRDEIKLAKADVGELKDRFRKSRFRPPRNELDPWLRLHLYAQRAEKLYADFHETFGIEPADYEDYGPILGQKNKFLLLVCERKSEVARYLKGHLEVDADRSLRWSFPGDCFLYATNAESLREGWSGAEVPAESMLATDVLAGLSLNLIDGYRDSNFAAPVWLKVAISHYFSRQYDPRWVSGAGSSHSVDPKDELWKWEGRVLGLVKKKFFVSAPDMFQWKAIADLNARDHMVAWSRLQFLLSLDADHSAFLETICSPLEIEALDPAVERVQRQTKALALHYELTPEAFEKKWASWVKRAYRNK